MKVLAFVLLCALVAVQARNTGVQSTRSAAALGENPSVVHLRLAVDTSGLLETCVGTLVSNRWVLTAASCVSNSRFIWIRYGVVNVINPSLVTESSSVRLHPELNVALIDINRYIENSVIKDFVSLAGVLTDTARFCGFSTEGKSEPGEQLNCYEVGVESAEDGTLTVSSDELIASRFDVGAPLIFDRALVGVLTGAGSEENVGDFLAADKYVQWIKDVAGLP